MASKNPDLVKEMAEEWQRWAEKVGAVPKPPKTQKINESITLKTPVGAREYKIIDLNYRGW